MEEMAKELAAMRMRIEKIELSRREKSEATTVEDMHYGHQGYQNGYFNEYYDPSQGEHNYNNCSDYFYPPNFSNNNGGFGKSNVGAEEEIGGRELLIIEFMLGKMRDDRWINRIEIQIEKLEAMIEKLLALMISLQTALLNMATRLGIELQPHQFPHYQNGVPIDCRPKRGDNSSFGFGNHPHFSCNNSNNALQPCLGFPGDHQKIDEPKKQITNDLLASFMENTKQISRLEATVATMSSTVMSMNTQLANMASMQFQQKGEPTAQSVEPNKEECPKATPILTSLQPQIPLSSQKKPKLNKWFKKSFDVFCRAQSNSQLAAALQHVPSYANMLKEKVDKKRNLNGLEEIQLSANSGDIILNHRAVKQKHNEQFIIWCTLGEAPTGKALCDLRETVNLMPLSVFVQFNIGNLKPSTIKLKMGDDTIAHAVGIVEDVLVKVDNFIFPIDFLVVNMQADKSVPLILGKPFLDMCKEVIDRVQEEIPISEKEEKNICRIQKVMIEYEKMQEEERIWKEDQRLRQSRITNPTNSDPSLVVSDVNHVVHDLNVPNNCASMQEPPKKKKKRRRAKKKSKEKILTTLVGQHLDMAEWWMKKIEGIMGVVIGKIQEHTCTSTRPP